MIENLTLEALPNAVSQLSKKLENIERLLIEKSNQQSSESTEQLLTVQEAGQFLSLSVATIYSKVSKGELPFMKRSKRLYFSSTELMEYIKEGRKKTNAEIEADVDAYLSNNKKGLQL